MGYKFQEEGRKLSQRILIVDDNHALVLAAKLVLEKNGYNVMVAYDGLEGLETAHKEKPDLILLDINMPTLNGYQVCRKLKSEPDFASIPVIILSVKGEIDESKNAPVIGLDEVNEAYASGATNFLTKPVSADELITTIKNELLFCAHLNDNIEAKL
jgi:CheY-like chemotaxis protein